jgi:hypothetical protein
MITITWPPDLLRLERRPDMCVSEYNRVRLSIANPHHAPPTQAELCLAAKVDAIVDQHHGEAVA